MNPSATALISIMATLFPYSYHLLSAERQKGIICFNLLFMPLWERIDPGNNPTSHESKKVSLRIHNFFVFFAYVKNFEEICIVVSTYGDLNHL